MVEYPIALVLSTIAVGSAEASHPGWRARLVDVLVPAAMVVALLLAVQQRGSPSIGRWAVVVFAPAALYVQAANMRGISFTLLLESLYAASLLAPSPFGDQLFAERSFYMREAMKAYTRRLAPDGILLLHVANRCFRLLPVLAAVSPLVRMEARVNDDPYVTPAQFAAGKYEFEWVIVARPREVRALGPRWRPIGADGRRPWTDDYSNPVGALGWFARGQASGAGGAAAR